MHVSVYLLVCVYNFLCHVCLFVCITYVRTVDKWRVVLKGETPDYINASSINVSSSTNTLSNVSHHLGTHVIHSQGFLEDDSRQEKWCDCHALKPAGGK